MFKNLASALFIGIPFLIGSLYSEGPTGGTTDIIPQNLMGPTGPRGLRSSDGKYLMGPTGPMGSTGPTGAAPPLGISVLQPLPQMELFLESLIHLRLQSLFLLSL